jgi:hypothetical protein
LPTQEVITLNISTPDVIVKGMSRIWRSSWIMKGVGPLQNIFKRNDEWSDAIKKLSVPQKVKPMLERLEKPTKLEDFLEISPLNNFETCKWLWAFSIIGVIEKVPSTPLMPLKPPTVKEELDIVFDIDPAHAISQALDAVLVTNPVQATSVREASFSEMEALMDTNPGLEQVFVQDSIFPPVETEEVIREREIRNLNEKQRFIFERLRFEMGAGVGNFLTKILKKVCGKYPLLFEGVEINEFGELNVNSLNHNIEGNMFESYKEAFAYFQEEQQKVIRSFFDSKTVEAISTGLQKIAEEQNRQTSKSAS